MELWHLDLDEYSGIFSSKEKAIEVMHKAINDNEWVILAEEDCGDWINLAYAYDSVYGWQTDHSTIIKYILDEVNGPV